MVPEPALESRRVKRSLAQVFHSPAPQHWATNYIVCVETSGIKVKVIVQLLHGLDGVVALEYRQHHLNTNTTSAVHPREMATAENTICLCI
jgi:hypothetical protein